MSPTVISGNKIQTKFEIFKKSPKNRDACSWKGQLERTRSWKVLSWKVWSWKEPSEVGKNRLKLERTERSWKASFEVRKFRWSWKVSPRLESSGWSWKVWMNLESCDWCWEVHHKFQIRVRETYKLGTVSVKPLNLIKQNFSSHFHHHKNYPNPNLELTLNQFPSVYSSNPRPNL